MTSIYQTPRVYLTNSTYPCSKKICYHFAPSQKQLEEWVNRSKPAEIFSDTYWDDDDGTLLSKDIFLIQRLKYDSQLIPRQDFIIRWDVNVDNDEHQLFSYNQTDGIPAVIGVLKEHKLASQNEEDPRWCGYDQPFISFFTTRYTISESLYIDFCKWNYYGSKYAYIVGTVDLSTETAQEQGIEKYREPLPSEFAVGLFTSVKELTPDLVKGSIPKMFANFNKQLELCPDNLIKIESLDSFSEYFKIGKLEL